MFSVSGFLGSYSIAWLLPFCHSGLGLLHLLHEALPDVLIQLSLLTARGPSVISSA